MHKTENDKQLDLGLIQKFPTEGTCIPGGTRLNVKGYKNPGTTEQFFLVFVLNSGLTFN